MKFLCGVGGNCGNVRFLRKYRTAWHANDAKEPFYIFLTVSSGAAEATLFSQLISIIKKCTNQSQPLTKLWFCYDVRTQFRSL